MESKHNRRKRGLNAIQADNQNDDRKCKKRKLSKLEKDDQPPTTNKNNTEKKRCSKKKMKGDHTDDTKQEEKELNKSNEITNNNNGNTSSTIIGAEIKGMIQPNLHNGNIIFWNKDQTKMIKISSYHIYGQSHKYENNKNMMGIIFYGGDTEFKLRPGHILLAHSTIINKMKDSDETMHAATFRFFTGKNINECNVIGAGFSIQHDPQKMPKLVFNSGTFNKPTNNYGLFHDDNREMHVIEQYVLNKAMNNWINDVGTTKIVDVINENSEPYLKELTGKQD